MAELLKADGTKSGTVKLDGSVFGIQPNIPVMHQVVTAQLAAKRSGTQSVQTRSDVRGGGAKPWRQKGTGKARAGSTRSPIWEGGGKAHAPKPRSYEQKTPKKMIRLALNSALSDRASDNKVLAVDGWTSWSEPKTKLAINFLEKAGLEGKVLVVLDEGTQDDYNAYLSFRNLEKAHVLVSAELNTYDILDADWVVFSKSCLPTAGSDPVKASASKPAEEAGSDPGDAQ